MARTKKMAAGRPKFFIFNFRVYDLEVTLNLTVRVFLTSLQNSNRFFLDSINRHESIFLERSFVHFFHSNHYLTAKKRKLQDPSPELKPAPKVHTLKHKEIEKI